MPDATLIRTGFFLFVLIGMGVLETLFPRRKTGFSRFNRWKTNLSMILIGNLVVYVCLPLVPYGVAEICEKHQWGLLPLISDSRIFQMIAGIMALDLAVYWMHRGFHSLSWLWKLHRMHHSDRDFDASTALRFHPIETLLAAFFKMGCVLALGVPATGVMLFEALLNACALFNHSNFKLPPVFDRFLRLVIITPDFHRVHHSVKMSESNLNFGFNIPWWDRLFGTYQAQPESGHEGMRIGLESFMEERYHHWITMLRMPWIK